MSGAEKKRYRNEEYEEVFAGSKKILRSPTYKQREREESTNMEGIEGMFMKMMEQLKIEMRKNTDELKAEINNVRKEMKEKEKQWELEKKLLEERIKKLEIRTEMEDRKRRRNNIIVRNLQVSDGKEKVEIRKFIAEKLETNVEITRAFKINKGKKNEMVLAEVQDWNQKQSIMKNKNKLRGQATIIENDLTEKERTVQRQIIEISKQEKEKGKTVKVGYQKIKIDEKVYFWDENEQGVTEIDTTKKSAKN